MKKSSKEEFILKEKKRYRIVKKRDFGYEKTSSKSHTYDVEYKSFFGRWQIKRWYWHENKCMPYIINCIDECVEEKFDSAIIINPFEDKIKQPLVTTIVTNLKNSKILVKPSQNLDDG